MSKYICPLCGKVHYDVESLSACTARDAKAIKEKENKLKEKKSQIDALQKSLSDKKKEIDAIVAQLQNKVSEYNTIGRKLIANDPKSDTHCTFSISFTTAEADKQFEKEALEQFGKTLSRITSPTYKSDLDDLIDKLIF